MGWVRRPKGKDNIERRLGRDGRSAKQRKKHMQRHWGMSNTQFLGIETPSMLTQCIRGGRAPQRGALYNTGNLKIHVILSYYSVSLTEIATT